MPMPSLMPARWPTMTEGNRAKWHKREGDAVGPGDIIAEIETDKATMEIEAVDEGILGRILVPEGTEGIAVNAPIALLLTEGEDPASLDAAPLAAALIEAPPVEQGDAPAAPPRSAVPPASAVARSPRPPPTPPCRAALSADTPHLRTRRSARGRQSNGMEGTAVIP